MVADMIYVVGCREVTESLGLDGVEIRFKVAVANQRLVGGFVVASLGLGFVTWGLGINDNLVLWYIASVHSLNDI